MKNKAIMNTRSIRDKSADAGPAVEWLVNGAKGAPLPQDVLFKLCTLLVDGHLPICRGAVFVTTLHPNIMGRGFFWRRGAEEVTVAEAPYGVIDTDEFQHNPLIRVFKDGVEIRRRLCDPECPDDFLILDELRDQGVTDYIAMPLDFTNGEVHAVSWSTDQKGGFTDVEIEELHKVRPPLARIAEIFAHRRTARNLLDAYLGARSGEKVLHGQIKRGDGQEIHAVVWFCDLRNSTPLADSMSRWEFLELLNGYFEAMGGAVLDHGGEVLRFIGDAVLAIFPVSDDGFSIDEACRRAVEAAHDAVERMEVLNRDREKGGNPPLGFGIGLHLGDVMYGNIGTEDRIEFTVVGAAANEAARIESQTKTLGVPFIVSENVVAHLSGDWRSLGRYALRGVGHDIEIFTEADGR